MKAVRYKTPYPKGAPAPAPITQDSDSDSNDEHNTHIGARPAPAKRAERRRSSRFRQDCESHQINIANGNTFVSLPSAGITIGALNNFMGNIFMDKLKGRVEECENCDPEHVANGVVHPVSKETITKYKKLIADPILRDTWLEAMCKELGRLAQGYGDTKGTNTIRFMNLSEIKDIPKDRVVTYARIVVDYRPQKNSPEPREN